MCQVLRNVIFVLVSYGFEQTIQKNQHSRNIIFKIKLNGDKKKLRGVYRL